jgi:hypothetical protein
MAPDARLWVSEAGLEVIFLRHLAIVDRPELLDRRFIVGVRQAQSGALRRSLACHAQRVIHREGEMVEDPPLHAVPGWVYCSRPRFRHQQL